MTMDIHPSFSYKNIFYGLVIDSCTTQFAHHLGGFFFSA